MDDHLVVELFGEEIDVLSANDELDHYKREHRGSAVGHRPDADAVFQGRETEGRGLEGRKPGRVRCPVGSTARRSGPPRFPCVGDRQSGAECAAQSCGVMCVTVGGLCGSS